MPQSRALLRSFWTMLVAAAMFGARCYAAAIASDAAGSSAAAVTRSESNGVSLPNWLPPDGTPKSGGDEVLAAVDKFLSEFHGQARPLACWYRDSLLTDVAALRDGSRGARHTKWRFAAPVSEKEGVLDLEARFELVEGEASNAGVAMAFDFFDWDAANYVFASAMLYDGNKFRIVPLGYPPYLHDPKDRPLDMPVTTTNILHLNKDRSPGRVEMKTFNLSTPLMGFYDARTKRGFLLLTDPTSALGVSGMIVQEDPGKRLLSLVVNAPGVRLERYKGIGARAPSGDRGADLRAPFQAVLKFKLYKFEAADLPAFFAKAFEVRKALSGPTVFRNVLPFSAAAELIGEHQEKNKWFEENGTGYYVNRHSSDPAHNQAGWGGNPTSSQPPAILLTPERLRRIGLTWDMLTRLQGSTGLMRAMMHKGVIQGDTFENARQQPDIAMVRRTGDVLYGGIVQFQTLSAHGEEAALKPAWKSLLRRCADALVTIYEKYGQFGQVANVETGEMVVNGSTSGALNIGALAQASVYFQEPRYLKVAEAAGEMYYRRDLAQGYCGGAPAEILQSPDSEAAWELAKSYLDLYDVSGNPQWLKYARDAIHMYATWIVSYDYAFPANSTLGRIGAQTTGSMFASSANNHSAPGTYVDSADFLLRFYRATGESIYAELYKDAVHNVLQYVNTEHNRIQPRGGIGYVSERVQMSDWEGGDFGVVPDGDSNYAWECLAQLTSLQNPGIYLNTTTGAMIVLDHVKAEIVRRDARGTTLRLHNDTPYDARVSLFAETSENAKSPLGNTAFLHWPKVAVSSGDTVEVTVDPEGKFQP
jgi:hypothetical protein